MKTPGAVKQPCILCHTVFFFFLLNKGVQLQEKKDPHLVGGSPLGFYILRVFR